MENKLSPLQQKLLTMLEWYHDFCVKNNLTYYVAYGTLLGAVRHSGFIPWDDDVDVLMPRPDYEKFLEIMKNNPDNIYYAERSGKENEEYYYSYAKVYDTTTTLIERNRRNVKRGVYIDVFPLDGIPSDMKPAKRHFRRVNFHKKLIYARNIAIKKENGIVKNVVALISRIIPMAWLKNSKIVSKIESEAMKYKYCESEYVGCMHSGDGLKEHILKSVYGEPSIYKFEGIDVYAPHDADAYLRQFFGDYMQLPPESERVSHHSHVECDLHKSYLNK